MTLTKEREEQKKKKKGGEGGQCRRFKRDQVDPTRTETDFIRTSTKSGKDDKDHLVSIMIERSPLK